MTQRRYLRPTRSIARSTQSWRSSCGWGSACTGRACWRFADGRAAPGVEPTDLPPYTFRQPCRRCRRDAPALVIFDRDCREVTDACSTSTISAPRHLPGLTGGGEGHGFRAVKRGADSDRGRSFTCDRAKPAAPPRTWRFFARWRTRGRPRPGTSPTPSRARSSIRGCVPSLRSARCRGRAIWCAATSIAGGRALERRPLRAPPSSTTARTAV